MNTFHNGHIDQINNIRLLKPNDCIIAVMSGNIVQRGDFSIQDKYTRAKNAINNGCNLVLELPFPFSCSSAEQFAKAGVNICDNILCDTLFFGTTKGDTSYYFEIAKNILEPNFKNELKKNLSNFNQSYINNLSNTYKGIYGIELPNNGNDILAIEYIKSIIEIKSQIAPIALKRTSNFSATNSRKCLLNDEKENILLNIPRNSDLTNISKGLSKLSQFILCHLKTQDIKDSGNGIRNAIKKAAKNSNTYEEFLSLLPTKIYTNARLNREIISIISNTDENYKNSNPKYSVLLAADEIGTEYLSKIRKECKLPILTKLSDSEKLDDEGKNQLELSIKMNSLYGFTFDSPTKIDYFNKPIIK